MMKKLSTKGTQKIMAILCVFCMMFMLCAETSVVYAQGEATITASSGTAEKGKNVAVSFELSGNPGIWAMKFRVGYDHNALTLKSASAGSVFAQNDVMLPSTENLNKDKFVFFASANSIENISKNGNLVTLNFSVSDKAEEKAYAITVEIVEVINVDGKDVTVNAKNGNITVKCTHEAAWEVTQKAGCETDGTKVKKCTKCGETLETETIKATGHVNTEIKNAVSATTEKEGYTGDKYCNDCKTLIEKGKIIPKLKEECTHKETEWKVTQEAGCETKGMRVKICKKCGETISKEEIKATGHVNTEIKNAVSATTEKEGYTGDKYCNDCKTLIEKGKIIPKLKEECTHKETEWKVTQEAGCETKGTRVKICKKCGETISKEETKATGHVNTERESAVPATTTAEGYTGDLYCNDCGKLIEKGKVIPKLEGDEKIPELTEGKESVFHREVDKELVFISDADFETFLCVEIDGEVIAENAYTCESGSTIVTLKGEYLNTLTNGNHTIAIVSSTGRASTEFTIEGEVITDETQETETQEESEASPETNETFPTRLIAGICVLACVAVLIAVFARNYRKGRRF